MEVLAITGLLIGGWLIVKWFVGAVLYVICNNFALICDVCGHSRRECGCYRDRDEY